MILLERGLTGQQASGVNFGGIRRQGRALPQLAMANRALETWRRSKELLNEDVEFLPSGHTRVCYHEHDADYFDRYAADARAYGLDLEVLHGAAMFERFPFLGREVLAASISPLDGHANPRLASPAFARAAARLGARIVENTEIVRVEKDGDGFRVESAAGDVYRAAQLVICAGAWASALTQQFGEPVPLRGARSANGRDGAGAVCVQVVDGRVHVGQGGERLFPPDSARQHHPRRRPGRSRRCRHASRFRAAAATPSRQIAQFRRLVPALAPLNVIRVWSGVEGYLPDSEPVIGPSSKVDGLFYAFGFSGSGFQIGPGVGETLAELVDTGRTPIPLDAFSIRRFALAPETSVLSS